MRRSRKRENLRVRVSKKDIVAALRKLGLKKGDVAGVHSSLSSFGYVEGGADVVIDALPNTVGREGTIVMPTHSTNTVEVEPKNFMNL
jgi:aminoglycoside 3-N-acetyltransferase